MAKLVYRQHHEPSHKKHYIPKSVLLKKLLYASVTINTIFICYHLLNIYRILTTR